MKQIPLTQGKYVLVDDEDYDYLNQWKWYAYYAKKRDIWYVMRSGSRSIKPRRMILMHRVIMQAVKGEEIDHEDHNGLNNQRYNLRKATRLQNSRNRKKQNNNTSGFKGVSFRTDNSNRPWVSYISDNHKLIHLGSYATAIEAAMAYDQAAKLYFGEFAKLNFSEK